jgi:hypothetical protein
VWPRPINNEGLPLDEVHRDEAPVSAILAIVPIVSHDEIVTVWNGHGAEGAIFARGVPNLKGVPVFPIRVIEQDSVNGDVSSIDLNILSRQTDYSLYVIFVFSLRIDKDDDVTPFRILDGDQRLSQERDLNAVNELVDKDVVSDQEGRLHRSRGNLKGLDDKGANEQGEKNSDNNGFSPLPYGAFFLSSPCRFLICQDFLQSYNRESCLSFQFPVEFNL